MKKYLKLSITLLSLFLVASCSGNSLLKNYSNQNPKIDIKTYFNGDIESWGFVEDGDGKVIKRFTAKINGKWLGNKGIIQEEFLFNNGEKDARTWMISLDDKNNNFTAIAHDIIGTAKGSTYGDTIFVEYVLTILDGKNKSNVNTEDLIYLIDDKSAISIAKLNGFIFNKGKIVTSYKKISNSNNKSSLETEQSGVIKNSSNLAPVVSEENKNKLDNK